MKRTIKFTALLLSLSLILAGCGNTEASSENLSASTSNAEIVQTSTGVTSVDTTNLVKLIEVDYKDSDSYFDYTKKDYTKITFTGSDVVTEDSSITIEDDSITIAKEGVYVLSGSTDKTVKIAAGEEAKVYLVLDNISIAAKTGPAIYEESADKVIILLPEKRENHLSDSGSYSENYDENVTGAVYCKDSLTVCGEGKLTVSANKNDGITTKDNLKITGGDISISSVDDGIVAKDLFALKDGKLVIDAKGDGIKTTYEGDEDKGNAVIDGGSITITSVKDGIDVSGIVDISSGEINILTGDGADINTKTEDSGKGIKANKAINIIGGIISINANDDAIHSDTDITINNANISVASSDDGIHAGANLTVDGGEITVVLSYEGLEGNTITINGGVISSTASDDGLNAAGSNSSSSGDKGDFDKFDKGNWSSDNARPGWDGQKGEKPSFDGQEPAERPSFDNKQAPQMPDSDAGNFDPNNLPEDFDANNVPAGFGGGFSGGGFAGGAFDTDESAVIEINGGDVYVNAGGDGIDSNGYIRINGGKIFVDGPTDGANAPIDYGIDLIMNGGELVACGSSGMYQSIGEDSKLNSINYFPDSAIDANTKCGLYDGDKLITEFTVGKKSQSILISNSSIEEGKTYTLKIGDEKVEVNGEKYLQTSPFGGRMNK